MNNGYVIIWMIKMFRKGKKIMKRISTGIENFKELLDNNYYYVDKTMLIKDALSDKVTLIQDQEDLERH